MFMDKDIIRTIELKQPVVALEQMVRIVILLRIQIKLITLNKITRRTFYFQNSTAKITNMGFIKRNFFLNQI